MGETIENQIVEINRLVDDKKCTARKLRVELMKYLKMETDNTNDHFQFVESIIGVIADKKAVEQLEHIKITVEAQISSTL